MNGVLLVLLMLAFPSRAASSSYTPLVSYLRLLAALRHHALHIAVSVFTQDGS